MIKYIVILLMACSIVFSEEKKYTFTAEEVQTFRSSIIELEQKDSLNVDIIKGLESQIFNYELQIQNDSLIISQLELKNKLQSDLVKLVKPKWYENKYLWFFGGFLSFYLATDAVNNLK
tara:strand:+ start:93 stop:449 length:357 start_codon:yes stop_codon:yes gene_type:complete